MKHIFASGVMALSVAACGGSSTNPVVGGAGGTAGSVSNSIPDELAGNLSTITYDPSSETLVVDIFALDNNPKEVVFERNSALDTAGYKAYSTQDDVLDRMFVALVDEAPRGSVTAAAVRDGGQFGTSFSGGYYQRQGNYSMPTSGQVSYAGRYAGLADTGSLNDHLLPVPPALAGEPELLPYEPGRIEGDIFINANFDDGAINGAVINRRFVETGQALESLDLMIANIDENGEFLGTVEFTYIDEGTIGQYGGIFGGTNASDVAGVVVLNDIYGPANDVGDWEDEVGIFVLPQCGTDGSPLICDFVNDLSD